MKQDRHAQTAERYGIRARLESLETDLLKIHGLVSVEFDIDSLIDNIPYIIILAGYDIDVSRPDYYQARGAVRRAIIETCAAHDLYPTGDAIEDYGEHFYFVRQQGASWKPLPPCKCGGSATLRYIKEFGQWAIECSKNGHIHNTGFCGTAEQARNKWEEYAKQGEGATNV